MNRSTRCPRTATSHDAVGALRVVVGGGGVAGLEALLALRALAGDRVRLTLVAPAAEFTYRPLAVAEPSRSAAPSASR